MLIMKLLACSFLHLTQRPPIDSNYEIAGMFVLRSDDNYVSNNNANSFISDYVCIHCRIIRSRSLFLTLGSPIESNHKYVCMFDVVFACLCCDVCMFVLYDLFVGTIATMVDF